MFSVVVYLLSGIEDGGPDTLPGKIGAAVILCVGPLLIAYVTGLFVGALQKQLLRGFVIPRVLRNLYVIYGWNERALGIILQLRDESIERQGEKYPIAIIGSPEEYEDSGIVR